MDIKYLLICILIMTIVTYLPRMLPLVFFRKKISNVYIRSFLIYMPYGILAAMIFPGIFYSTSSYISAVCGMIAALILSYMRKGLLTVALTSVITVFIVELII